MRLSISWSSFDVKFGGSGTYGRRIVDTLVMLKSRVCLAILMARLILLYEVNGNDISLPV